MRRKSVLSVAFCTVFLLVSAGAIQGPYFNYTRTAKLLLNWDDVWEVGDYPALAVLKAGSMITVWLRVAGDNGIGLRRLLSFRCPKARTQDTIDLDSVGTGSKAVKRCQDTLPIIVAKTGNINKFSLRIGESYLAISEVFKEAVELQVQVEFATGRILSRPLRIWNLDTLSVPPSTTGGAPASLNPGLLTSGAVSFATNISGDSDTFTSIDFVNPVIIKALADGPMFFQAKLNLGMILYFDSSSCLTYQLTSSILLTNYHSKMDSDHRNLGKLAYLNIRDGKLWYSKCALSREVKQFYKERNPLLSIGICTLTTLTGDAEPYVNVSPVKLKVELKDVLYQGCEVAFTSRKCEIVPNVSSTLALISGMDNTAIVCPIVCNSKNEDYRFYRDDKPLIGSPTKDWIVVDGIRVSNTGNILEFPATVSAAHSGTYRCEAGSVQFKFTVTVVSLPLFVNSVISSSGRGLLPEKVFAMEGESVAYDCAVNFASLRSVKVTPVFYIVATTGNKPSWEKLSEDKFRDRIGASNQSLVFSSTETNSSQTLSVTVSNIPTPTDISQRNFSHRFECSASVDSTESLLAGMSDYEVQSSRSEVVFISRLKLDSFELNPSNNCSVQRCVPGKGAFFEFSLTSSTANILKAIGVEVAAYFRLGKVPLHNLQVLFRDNASLLEVDNDIGRLAFRIYPVSSPDVMKELIARSSITAVFNLRYKANTNLGSLRILKDAYGERTLELGQLDCRADPLCFYSTDFDIDGSLSFLTTALTFKQPPELPQPQLAAASAVVAGIIIGILVLIIGVAIIVYLTNRKPERIYQVEEMEIMQGYNPQQEVRAEVFGEYQRPSNLEGVWEPAQPRDQLSLISGLSETSVDEGEADPEDIDFREFGEQGSFIGNYQADPRRRDLPGAPSGGLHF